MSEHTWKQDGHDKIGNVISKCATCGVRKIENCSTFWQRSKGRKWIDTENEETPACNALRLAGRL